jgi:hypothetical protein
MRVSCDEYVTREGERVFVSLNEEAPAGAVLVNGYDYVRQCWVINGEVVVNK